MDKYDILIKKARDILRTKPFDGVHDLSHHVSVYKTALQIAENINFEFDKKTLELAVMWHDVTAPGNEKNEVATAELIKDEMVALDFSDKDINEVYNAIAHHGYNQQPRNMIGKMLWDADKLDFLSINRWKNGLKMETDGKATFKAAKEMFEKVLKMIPTIPEKLHFEISQQIFDERLKELKASPVAKKIAEHYGCELRNI